MYIVVYIIMYNLLVYLYTLTAVAYAALWSGLFYTGRILDQTIYEWSIYNIIIINIILIINISIINITLNKCYNYIR